MNQQMMSLLLELPAELRNSIYVLVFQGCMFEVDLVNHGRARKAVGLLLACKQTFAEAVSFYYRNVTIECSSILAIIHRTQYLPPQHLQLIPEIKLISLTLAPQKQFLASAAEARLDGLANALCGQGLTLQSVLTVEMRTYKTVIVVCTGIEDLKTKV